MRMVTTHTQDYRIHRNQLGEGLKLISMFAMKNEEKECWCKNSESCDICRAKKTFKENIGILSYIIDAEEDIYCHLEDLGVLTFPSYPAAVEKELLGIFSQEQVKTLNLDILAQAFGYWQPKEEL